MYVFSMGHIHLVALFAFILLVADGKSSRKNAYQSQPQQATALHLPTNQRSSSNNLQSSQQFQTAPRPVTDTGGEPSRYAPADTSSQYGLENQHFPHPADTGIGVHVPTPSPISGYPVHPSISLDETLTHEKNQFLSNLVHTDSGIYFSFCTMKY